MKIEIFRTYHLQKKQKYSIIEQIDFTHVDSSGISMAKSKHGLCLIAHINLKSDNGSLERFLPLMQMQKGKTQDHE